MSEPVVRETLAGAIARALHGLRFGSVEITVHDGRVTLIERREKLRVNDVDAPDGAEWRSGEPGSRGDAGPIGRPKDARARGVNPIEEDPTGRPEVPLTERADDATRNQERSSWSDVDSHDGSGRPVGGDRRRSGTVPPLSQRGGAGA